MTAAGTWCDRCGVPIGAPHERLDNDCVLPHSDHAERGVGLICRRHWHWLNDTLTQIEELFALRGDVVVPGPASDERRSASLHSPAPGRLDVMALTDRRVGAAIARDDVPDVLGVLGAWMQQIVEETHTAPQPPVGPACAIIPCWHQSCAQVRGVTRVTWSEMLTTFRRHRHWIAGHDLVVDFADTLTDVHRALARGVGASMWPTSIGACPNCKARLFNTTGADEVTCRRCTSTWTGVHLVRLRLMLEQAQA